jgi:hypothetical protein
MAGLTHTTVAVTADDGSEVGTDAWNEAHTVTGDVDMLAYDLKTDDIIESTATAGVTIDGVLVKDTSITFNDEALGEYDEGTWTPGLDAATPGDLAVSYFTQGGAYTRVGRLVVCHINLRTTSFTHTTASGLFLVTGLPFTAGSDDGQGAVLAQGWTKAGILGLTIEAQAGQTSCYLIGSRSGSSVYGIAITDCPTGGIVDIEATIAYYI